jgi:hypothetical protein
LSFPANLIAGFSSPDLAAAHEIRAKGGLPVERVEFVLKQLDAES